VPVTVAMSDDSCYANMFRSIIRVRLNGLMELDLSKVICVP